MRKTNDVPVVTVDGPVGSGKGTVCSLLAIKLAWNLLDSGSLYRLVAFAAMKKNIVLTDVSALSELAGSLDVEFRVPEGGGILEIFLEKVRVDQSIREERIGLNASVVAKLPEVRHQLLARQRAFAKKPGLIADGRDMGTVVFPEAAAKFFLTASAQERASRRYLQLQEKGCDVSIDRILSDVIQRDKMDTERKTSPLCPAEDAVVIDSTSLSAREVVDSIIDTLSVRRII